IGEVDPLLRGLEDASPRVQRGALIAIHQLEPARLTLNDLAPLLGVSDAALRRSVLKIYREHAQDQAWSASAAKHLRNWLADESQRRDRIQTIRELAQTFAGTDPVAQV